jgi:AraC-like DNA-binding protein
MDLTRDVFISEFNSNCFFSKLQKDKEYVRILILKSGKGILYIGKKKLFLKNKSAVVIPRGIEAILKNSRVISYLMKIKEGTFLELLHIHPPFSGLGSWRIINSHQFDLLNIFRDIELIIRKLIITKKPSQNAAIISIYYETIILLLLSQICSEKKNVPSKVSDRFVLSVMKNMKENYSLTEYANLLRISTSKLYKHCVNDYDKSPKALISEIKYFMCSTDLILTELNCTEIAYKYGFYDSSHFNRFFKLMSSKSPKLFRIHNRNENK